MTPPPTNDASPERILATFNGYQQTALIKGAIELGLFTAIGDKGATVAELAHRCAASERGLRILSDRLVVQGLLEKHDAVYELTADAAMFLVKTSPGFGRITVSPTAFGAAT